MVRGVGFLYELAYLAPVRYVLCVPWAFPAWVTKGNPLEMREKCPVLDQPALDLVYCSQYIAHPLTSNEFVDRFFIL